MRPGVLSVLYEASRAPQGVKFLSRTVQGHDSLAFEWRVFKRNTPRWAGPSRVVRTKRNGRILTLLTAGPYSHGNLAPTTPFQKPVSLPVPPCRRCPWGDTKDLPRISFRDPQPTPHCESLTGECLLGERSFRFSRLNKISQLSRIC